MADLPCPMCGNPNPAHFEECRHCQARLIPLNLEESADAAAEPAAEDPGDWLRSLRKGNGEDGEDSSDILDFFEDEEIEAGDALLPDWISELGEPEAASRDPAGKTETLQEDIPDWLASLSDEPPAEKGSVDGAPVARFLEDNSEDAPSEHDDEIEEPIGLAEILAEEGPDEVSIQGLLDDLDTKTEEKPGTAAPAADIPDWIHQLEEQQEGSQEATSNDDPEATQPPEPPRVESLHEQLTALSEEPPDWLDELSSLAKSGSDEENRFGNLPTWVADLGQGVHELEAELASETTHDTERPETTSEELPEWLDEISALSTDIPEERAAQEDIPGWITEMGPDQEEPGSEQSGPFSPEGISKGDEPVEELQDWLGELSALGGEQADPREEKKPAWMSELDGPEAKEELKAPIDSQPDDDFLSVLSQEQAPDEAGPGMAEEALDLEASLETGEPEIPPARNEEVPDWLQELEMQGPPGGEGDSAALEEAEEIPDWITELAPDESESVEPKGALPARETPDWLEELETNSQSIFGEVKEGRAIPAENMPDWMAGLAPEEAREPEAETPAEEDLPNWLEEIETPAAEEQDEEIPDWLNEFTVSGSQTRAEEAESPPEDALRRDAVEESQDPEDADLFSPEWLAGFEEPEETTGEQEEEEEFPDWLNSFSEGAEPEEEGDPLGFLDSLDEEGGQDGLQPREKVENIPDWLMEKQPQAGADEESLIADQVQEFEDSPAGEDVDWQPAGGSPSSLGFDDSEGEQLDLEAGELPDWLRALAPNDVEPDIPAPVPEGETEQLGPLAGMQGLLSAQPGVNPAARPDAYSVKLRISDQQQSSIEALQKMIEQETAPTAESGERVFSEQRVLRWAIAVLVLVSVIFPFLSELPITSLPPIAPNTLSLGRIINELEDGTPVLMVVDFEPGMFAELNAASDAVLDHLMLQGADIALVSTSPIGPALGERLIARQAPDHAYISREDYVNLGYIPGGAAGLQNFAHFPREALQVGYDSRSLADLLNTRVTIWNSRPVEDVNSLADFGVTVMLTDDPDTARTWIEQVQPQLAPGSLAIISSAQAQPLIQPYASVEAGQVAALLSGVSGGASYEGFLTREGSARNSWDSMGVGLLAAILILVGSGAYNLYLNFREPKGRRRVGSE